ncbi:MAG: DUF3370 domain-containing protein [Oscillatoriales cyanobacterium RU_3_3]|nr:DUF3370 domain-containing protein [Oscillatoriales cyanobacterium RU_3_3]NJR25875.1 DUF3370 domain-containing protein [Richelia sp. CSU_2_1]
MLPILSILPLAQTPPAPQEILQIQEVRPLPGQLDNISVFNSNSPELVLQEGILLSTFPPDGKRFPAAHLNFPFQGRFDIFAHHIARATSPEDLRTLYQGVIVYNPGDRPVKLDVLQAASYLSQPDAPFIELPPQVDNSNSNIHAGPGSRAVNDVLRGKRQPEFPPQLIIPPGKSEMLMNHPIPVRELKPPLNGRSTLMRLRSDGKIYVASLAMFAKTDAAGKERSPNLAEWQNLLENSNVSGPRDRTPTPPQMREGQVIYGRVAGVAMGSQWRANLTDNPTDNTAVSHLTIPQPGTAFSYPLSTLPRGMLGTNQVQSARMLVRYPDTAYSAHGNYGIEYNLSLPLHNSTARNQTVTVTFQTPIKTDKLAAGGLTFLEPAAPQTFFRGTVRVRYTDDNKVPQTRYVHLVQRRGQQGEPLVKLQMQAGEKRLVEVDFIYPPDASPPQVLTVKTQEN